MPTNALANPLVVPILGVLVEAPRHPYAVFTEVRNRYDYLTVRNSTVCTLLNRLTDSGWVAPHGTQVPGQLRTTSDGARALAGEVERQVRDGNLTTGPEFTTALAYLSLLTPEHAEQLLRHRCHRVREKITQISDAVHAAASPEIRMIEAHYMLASLAQHAAWLQDTADRIHAGALNWTAN